MRRTKQLKLGARVVSVRELSVGEIRQWLADVSDEGNETLADFVNMTIIEGLMLDDLRRMTDLTLADMDALTPGELDQVAEACKEVNPGFFRVAAPLHRIARQALESRGSGNSNGASPRSSAPGTRTPGTIRGWFSRALSRS
jgi:hypothetical protein